MQRSKVSKVFTKYKRQPRPDSFDCQKTRDDSKTSTEKKAPEMAPTAAPQTKPLSVSWPIKAPVMAPNKVPTAATRQLILFYQLRAQITTSIIM